jgi:TonB family protein
MRFAPIAITVIVVLLATGPMGAQSRASLLVEQAHARLSVSDLDSAEALLRMALASATERSDSATTFAWTAILAFMRGDEVATRAGFHQALKLGVALNIQGLARASPRLAELYQEQVQGLGVYVSADVEEKPRRLSGPRIAYPPDLVRRQVRGRAMVGFIVDTLGHADSSSIEILAVPDSGYVAPLRRMILASTFAPGRLHGHPVRTMTELAIDLAPGSPQNATALIGAARNELAQRQPDSALALLREALDPATQPSEGEHVYALLVQGIAWKALGRDTLARAAFDTALDGYKRLTDRGVELAPFLKRLADSVRLGRSGRVPDALGRPSVVGAAVDVAPTLVSRPIIRYPPEMQALRVGGTVTIEVTLDATGHVVPGTVKVIQSPNPGLDAEARRVVAAAVYHPARRGGRPVTTVIRQTITFVPY